MGFLFAFFIIKRFKFLNDNTLEGFSCNNIPAFSVQFHPESSPGPHDSRYLFNEFISMIEKNHAKA